MIVTKNFNFDEKLMQHVMFDNNNGSNVAPGYVIITSIYNYDDVVIKTFNITITNPSQLRDTGNSINDYSARNLLLNMLCNDSDWFLPSGTKCEDLVVFIL